MANKKDRIVIIGVLFNFYNFEGFRCYNIDKEIIMDIPHNNLYLFNIWGIKKSAENYLYRNKRLKNNIHILKNVDEYRISKDFIGYKNLPIIDNGTGEYINILNRVIVYTYQENGIMFYKTISFNGNVAIFRKEFLLDIIRNNNNICNITNDLNKITPLNVKFYNKSLNNNSYDKNIDEYTYLENLLEFEFRERHNEFKRKLGLISEDARKNSIASKNDIREKESRDLVIKGILRSSDDIFYILSNKNLGHIFKNKQRLDNVNTFIDTEKILEDLNKMTESPCGDNICTSIIQKAKQGIKWGSYQANQREVAKVFTDNIGKILKKSECSNCFSIQNILGMVCLINNNNATGFFNSGIKDKTYIDVTNQDIFNLKTFKTMIHEYMHYLSYSDKKRSSGICKNGSYQESYKNLNEGITELLACYFSCGILYHLNDNSKLKYYRNGIKFMDKNDYKKYINPFLKNFSQLEDLMYEENFENNIYALFSYRYYVYFIIHIMKKVGVEKVFNCYFEADNANFEKLCIDNIGKEKWFDFLNLLENLKQNRENNTIEKQYHKIKKILLK